MTLPAVVDAKHILLHLDEEKPDGIINESIQQVHAENKNGTWWHVSCSARPRPARADQLRPPPPAIHPACAGRLC